jgi:hypothetical protein
MLFSERPAWIAWNPALRHAAVQFWRGLLRVQRATLAEAVLVVSDKDGRVLVRRAPSGELRLPSKPLDALLPITTQVEEWLGAMLQHRSTPALVAIEGTPSREGVTFLYAVTLDAPAGTGNELWLEPRAINFGPKDHRLLLLYAERATWCQAP